ncbi:hypothetical protein [Polaribacter atrinae]|uniref:Phosphoribosylpyrophosphate synthetase n=1 Tax=Polaribacter atrinae TaxID=1333662 RepID=A0A176TCQ7_9FLAO|nr:hypothetical protein [Polaribacter atrinae]OAD45640.1 hypothetical protein LPB303_04940 [Polaribacter atrinae]
MNTDTNELEIIKKYEEKGYTSNFRVLENLLIDNNTKSKYKPSEVFIVAEHRFEGMSNPADMSILYIIVTKNDFKGTFLASYGGAKDTEVAEFFNEIPKENVTNNENIFI